MTAVIIGAGRIGSSVLELAADADVEVTVIERDHKRVHELDTFDRSEERRVGKECRL